MAAVDGSLPRIDPFWFGAGSSRDANGQLARLTGDVYAKDGDCIDARSRGTWTVEVSSCLPGSTVPATSRRTSVGRRAIQKNAKGFERCASPDDNARLAAFALGATARAVSRGPAEQFGARHRRTVMHACDFTIVAPHTKGSLATLAEELGREKINITDCAPPSRTELRSSTC
jgi:hypothetical protein